MMNTYQTKKILIISLIILIVLAVILTINFKPKPVVVTEVPIIPPTVVETNTPINICYYRSDKTASVYSDVAWLKIDTIGDKVTGEFRHLPAESDSKVGNFEGVINSTKSIDDKYKATVWWDSRAEGMEVKEELAIEWSDNRATVGFGEMTDRGDGVYVYKDSSKITYIKDMNTMNCEDLTEKIFAEKYIGDNIAIIATNKPVLGGTWYVTEATADPTNDTVNFSYEDGHIASRAVVTYRYQKDPESIAIIKVQLVK